MADSTPARRHRRVARFALGAALALTLAAPAPPLHAADPVWFGSLAAAQAEARRSNRPILVDLYADWCGWCKQLESKVFTTPRFHEFAPGYVLLRVDTEDGAEGSQLMGRYGAETLPTTLVLTPDLVLAAKVVGFAPVDQFIARTERELAAFAELEKRYPAVVAGHDAAAIRRLAEAFQLRVDGRRAAALYRRLLAVGGLAPADEAMTRFMLGDTLRLAGDLAGARAEVAAARATLGKTPGAEEVLERLDLLAVQIAEEGGDCGERKAVLEAFLRDHPTSSFSAPARLTLKSLQANGAACS